MKDNELKERFIDEKTGIEYILVGDYYYPNLTLPENPYKDYIIGKYGHMRLNYLKQHRHILYSELLINGELNKHIAEIDIEAKNRVEQLIKELKLKSNLTEDMKNTDTLYWVGMMNNFKNQAEEIVCNEIIYN
jgi:hypothetical protein